MILTGIITLSSLKAKSLISAGVFVVVVVVVVCVLKLTLH